MKSTSVMFDALCSYFHNIFLYVFFCQTDYVQIFSCVQCIEARIKYLAAFSGMKQKRLKSRTHYQHYDPSRNLLLKSTIS